MLRFDVLTLFPEMFVSPLGASLLKKAQDRGMLEVRVHDIRAFAPGRHRVTDDAPYGGGGGMVMKVEPIDRALAAILPERGAAPVVLLTPQGQPFCQDLAKEMAGWPRMVLLCGHYEGVDERVRRHLTDREISLGDYVLTGGEVAALVVIDAVSRLLPGVLGNEGSAPEDSFATGLLEYPHYTRPAVYRGWKVPDVLLSGHHAEITAWRRREALRRTWERRPDLLRKAPLSEKDKEVLRHCTSTPSTAP